MKKFKRSQTSSKLKFNSNEIETKKIKSIDEKFEETIRKIANFLKQNDDNLNLNLPKLKEKKKETPFFKKKDPKIKVDYNNEIFSLDIINYILNKTKKNQDEILIIKVFLSSMNFLSTLKGTFNSDKLLHSLSNYLKIEKKSKDTLIFRYGNKGNKFYILIKGEVSVLILKEIKAHICFKRYFLHLMLLKMLKEDELVKKTISANAKIQYHFDERDFDIYYEKIVNFVNKYMNNNLKRKKNANQLISKKNSAANSNIYNFNKNQINDKMGIRNSNFEWKKNDNNRLNVKMGTAKNYFLKNKLSSKFLSYQDEENEEEEEEENDDKDINYANADLPFFNLSDVKEIIHYFMHLKEKIEAKPKNISVKDYINNTYLNSYFHKPFKMEEFSKKEDYILFHYFEITTRKVGESFGELALQREDNKRTATIITTTDCILGILSRSDYNIYLGEIEIKKRKNDINFMMSFAIFDRMNKIVFENRFFNFFKKETFKQGKNIILQENKITHVFFIMEGQFEIMTNLSLFNIYSLLNKKTKRNIDIEKKKPLFPKEEYNLRLYISYNKDVLGLGDCCFEDDISFITAKCLTDEGCAFTIEKSILNEMRHKIPEIDKNINIIMAKREKVMIDRLANIYNRIIQTKNKKKKDKFNENDKSQDSFKYINYFFGINQGDKNRNAKKISTKISSNKRVRSAFGFSNLKRRNSYFNEEEMSNNNIQFNLNITNKENSKIFSKTKTIDVSNMSERIPKDRLSPKNQKDKQKGRNTLDTLLNDKIVEESYSPLKQNQSNTPSLQFQSAKKSSNINTNLTREQCNDYNDLFNSINKNENENLLSPNLIGNNKSSGKKTIPIKKRDSKYLSNKILERRNSSDKYYLSFNKRGKKMPIKPRPFSNLIESKIYIKKPTDSISRNISNYNSYFDKGSKISRIPIYKTLKRSLDKNKTSRALSPDLKEPVLIKGKLNPEKFLKRLLGTRYKDQFISYEEQKFNKLIESYDLYNDFLSKSKKAKFKRRNYSEIELLKLQNNKEKMLQY